MEKFVNNFGFIIAIVSIIAIILSSFFPDSAAILNITGTYFFYAMIVACGGMFIITPAIAFGKYAAMNGNISLTVLASSTLLLIVSLLMNYYVFHLFHL